MSATSAMTTRGPQNLRTIRLHRTRRGREWQYWNWKIGRWSRLSGEHRSEDEAVELAATGVYGCAASQISVMSQER